MTTPQDRQATSGGDALLQLARTQVAALSVHADLPTPLVILVPSIGGPGSPWANAKFVSPRGVTTIKVTHAAMRELPPDALDFLLTHELGHYADASWWARRARVHGVMASVVGVLIFAGLVIAAVADTSGTSTLHGWIIFWTGLIVIAAVFLVRLADSRVGERRADVFAARQLGNLVGARELFAVWDRDTPEPEKGRRLTLLKRSHPYHSTRLETMQVELNRNDP
jgi:Zn-dependent protease with chaperone function